MTDYPTTRLGSRKRNEVISGPDAGLKGILKRMPEPTPQRLAAILRLLGPDADNLLPTGAVLPPAVKTAQKTFETARNTAQTVLERVSRAEAALREAGRRDARSAADALKGKSQLPDAQFPEARREMEQAQLAVAGAEVFLIEAHAALVEATRERWAELRRPLVERATSAHETAAQAVETAAQAVEERRTSLSDILALDRQIVMRYPELKAALEGETRCGFQVFQPAVSAHFHKPLTMAGPLSALDALREHLNQETPWVNEWAPPGDPERDALMQTPVDPSAAWVRFAVFKHDGPICPKCGLRLELDVELDAVTLEPKHEGCSGRPWNGIPRRLVVNG